MNHEKKIEIVYKGEVICEIDADNPNLVDFVSKIVNDEIDELDKLTCKASFQNFDSDSFTNVIKQTINDVNENLKSEIKNYSEIKRTLTSDVDVEQYYIDLKSNKKKSY